MMNVLLDSNQVSEGMVRQVAQKLVDFHEQAETNAEISKYGSLETIRINTEENFTQTEKYIGISISSEQYRGIKDYTDTFTQRNATLFEKRMKDGRIRDCHGDLHTAHICFINGICIYDCIEFNDRFRYCDVTSEIAFLAMDLDYHRRHDLSRQFIDAYVESSEDEGILKLLNFYKCYRAYVRGKVEGFKIDDSLIPKEEKIMALTAAKRYFELAELYIGMA
jgi:aminoglycoside phosphotransferase family enzyme